MEPLPAAVPDHASPRSDIGDVPLSADGSHGLIGRKASTCLPSRRWRSWGCALRSLAPAHGWLQARFRAADPTCHSPERPPRYSRRGIAVICSHTDTPHSPIRPYRAYRDGRSRTLRSASGIWPRKQSVLAARVPNRMAPRLGALFPVGPILPWAFGLSQAFGSPRATRKSASLMAMMPAGARLSPHASDPRSAARHSYPLPDAWAISKWSAQTADAGHHATAGSYSVLMRSLPGPSRRIRA
jgi:hypothetical protein